MDSKENMKQGVGDTFVPFIKPEPTDFVVPFANAYLRENVKNESRLHSPVKPEQVSSQSYLLQKSNIANNNGVGSGSSSSIRQDSDKRAVAQTPSTNVKSQDLMLGGVPVYFTKYSGVDDISYTPEKSLQEGLRMVKTLKAHVNQLELGSKMRKDVWLRDIAGLESQGTPSTLIAVCGATGAGKSSILNAILDDNIVPTSGMRACTAVVTEISYHKEKTIAADVSFLTMEEWRDELVLLLDDLVDENGQVRRTGDLRNEAGVAWHKVHAVYPRLTQDRLIGMTVDHLVNFDKKIAGLLGTVKKVNSRDSKEFAKSIAKYIDSKDQKRGKDKDKKKKDDPADGPALWPLIRQVNVKCSANALSTGAILVDLPGVADANAARSSIAREYMKKCDCVWILAPITRAVDDKTAKDLLGDAFKSQLMNGGFSDVEGTITFIATKCDDISCSEAIESLQLDDDPQLQEIEEILQQVRSESKEAKEKKADAEKRAKHITEELKSIRLAAAELERQLQDLEDGKTVTSVSTTKGESLVKKTQKRKNHREGKAGSPKRRRSLETYDSTDASDVEKLLDPEADMDLDDDFIDVDEDPMSDDNKSSEEGDDSGSNSSGSERDSDDSNSETSEVEDQLEDDDEEVIEEVVLTIDDVKAKISEKKEHLRDARERLSAARKDKKDALDALSSLEKKKVKAQRDKNGFCSLKRSEANAEAERRNPTTFDPTENLRDYASIDLPTFTVSARDYIRLTKQVKGDGDPTCFSNVADTGVPELQQWCKKLTVASRERAARLFRKHLRVFASGVKAYVKGFENVREEDRTVLREKWQTKQTGTLLRIEGDPCDNSSVDNDHGDEDDFFNLGDYRAQIEQAYSLEEPEGVSKLLARDFGKAIDDSVKEMQEAFKEGLEEKCQAGATYASQNAVALVDEIAASMHWATYRATLRRDGAWRRNINEELVMPMMKNIASSWAQVFEANLFKSFEADVLQAVNDLMNDFKDSCPAGLRERAKNQSDLCREEVKVALKNTVDIVSQQLQTNQKEISRCLSPHVQQQLSDGYYAAMQERGRGSVARQKAIFRNFVAKAKDDLFEGGADAILEKLDAMAVDVGKALVGSLANIADKVEVNLAVLWEGPVDVKSNVIERFETIDHVDAILGQLTLWDSSDEQRTKDASAPATHAI